MPTSIWRAVTHSHRNAIYGFWRKNTDTCAIARMELGYLLSFGFWSGKLCVSNSICRCSKLRHPAKQIYFLHVWRPVILISIKRNMSSLMNGGLSVRNVPSIINVFFKILIVSSEVNGDRRIKNLSPILSITLFIFSWWESSILKCPSLFSYNQYIIFSLKYWF